MSIYSSVQSPISVVISYKIYLFMLNFCSPRHVPPFGEAFSNDDSVAGNKFPVAYYVQNIHNQSIARKSEIFKVCLSAIIKYL